jgi:hypothetical protein
VPNDAFLGLTEEQWVAVSALAMLILVVITGIYAWLTKRAVNEASRSADAAERSASASTSAAEAASTASLAALRQAEAMERAELVNTMPMVYSIASGVDRNAEPPQFTVKLGNSGRGTAINISLRIFEGSLPGPTVVVRLPLQPGEVGAQEEKLTYPSVTPNATSQYKIEALYQNNHGREFASQSHPDGRVDYYLVTRERPGSTARFEALVTAPLPAP